MTKKRKTPSGPRAPNADSGGFGADEPTQTKTFIEWAITPPPIAASQADDELPDDVVTEAAIEALPREGESAGESARRLTGTLLRIFSRRRLQIRRSLDQLSRLSGISLVQLEALESARPGQTISYDQAVVLSRVLGVASDEMPGLRRRDTRAHLSVTVAELERTMMAAPLLRFEGKHGERYGGDVERAAASKAFTVRVEDESLEPTFPRGAMLAFVSGTRPRVGSVLLVRHLRSSLLALRRYDPPAYAGITKWQPGYVAGGEWHVVGCLEVMLPPR